MNYDPRTLSARHPGLTPLHASVILAQCCDERRTWTRILTSDDDRVVLSAMTFLVSMRDGRPAQQINVTSFGVQITTEEIESARAIVRELRGDRGELVSGRVSESEGSPSIPQRTESESPATAERTKGESLMLLGDQGAKKDGNRGV